MNDVNKIDNQLDRKVTFVTATYFFQVKYRDIFLNYLKMSGFNINDA